MPSQLLLMRSQERPLCWMPLPQVTEQWVHVDQGDQPSSSSTAVEGRCEGWGLLPPRKHQKTGIVGAAMKSADMKNCLTRSASRAALSVWHGGVSAWDQRAGDFATHGSRVLDRRTLELVQE